MPSYDTTGKFSLRALTGTSGINEIDDGFAALRDDVRDKMAGWAQGNAGAMPAASASNAGMIYQRTDSGQVFISTGSVWIPITGPVDRQTDVGAAEVAASGAFATILTTTFTPPFPNLEYQVLVTCGLFLSTPATVNGIASAVFEFRLDGVPCAYTDGNGGTVAIQTPVATAIAHDVQPAWHFPVLIPAGAHTLSVAVKSNGSAGSLALLRKGRRLTAIAHGYGTG